VPEGILALGPVCGRDSAGRGLPAIRFGFLFSRVPCRRRVDLVPPEQFLLFVQNSR
jgi:hypothetical protein